MKAAVTFLGTLAVIALLAAGVYFIWDGGGKLESIDKRIQALEVNVDEINKGIAEIDVRVKEIERILQDDSGTGDDKGGDLEAEEVAYNQRVRIEDESLQVRTISKVSFTPNSSSTNQDQKQSVDFVREQNQSDSSSFIHVNPKGEIHYDSHEEPQELQLSDLPDGGIVFTFPHFPASFEPLILELSADKYERDSVIVEFFDENDKSIASREYIPYGSVVTGEINISIKNENKSQQNCEQSIKDVLSEGGYEEISINSTTYKETEKGNEPDASEETQNDYELGAYKDSSINCLVSLFIEEEHDTEEVIKFLRDVKVRDEEALVNRNIILNANNGDNGYDPTCDQTKNWLKPFSNNYARSSESDVATHLASLITPSESPSRTLDPVTVVLIGGGVGKNPEEFEGEEDVKNETWLSPHARNFISEDHDPNNNNDHLNVDINDIYDEFECPDPDSTLDSEELIWVGHDTHIAQIIQDVAKEGQILQRIAEEPQIQILPLKVCDHRGSCATNNIIDALNYLNDLQTKGQISGKVIVNISLGGPLPDETLHSKIQEGSPSCASCPKFLVLASAGNKPDIPEHYPADYAFNPAGKAKISADKGEYAYTSLSNLLSVRATGRKGPKNSWQNANEINREKANLQAPGVNLCPATHDVDECDFNNRSISHGGLIGTSFAAASATGLATHHAQSLPLVSTSGGDNVYDKLLLEIPKQN